MSLPRSGPMGPCWSERYRLQAHRPSAISLRAALNRPSAMWSSDRSSRRVPRATLGGYDAGRSSPCMGMRSRLGGNKMGPPSPLSQRFTQLGVDRPRIAFSEVLAFNINGESIHVVHQKPGYSDADAIVHFHVANLIYLGEVFPGDGYPAIDTAQGGTLDGLVNTLDGWTSSAFRIVPARGKVTDGASV